MVREHRRLAAIVSADVAGYSRLMGRDDSDTLARLKAHRREFIDPKIAEYDGRIVKTTAMACCLNLEAWSMRSDVLSTCSGAWPSATRVGYPSSGWTSASASTLVTSLSTAKTFSGTVSMSHRVWRRWPSLARYA